MCVCGRQRRAGTKQSDLLLYLVPIAVGVAPLLGFGSSQFVDALRSAPLGRAAAPPTCSRVLHSLDGNNVAIAGALPTARRPPARPASS
jgi:hypothetical protein